MREINVNNELISYCGLYCGSCSRYQANKCPGCHDNDKATWCTIRKCNIDRGYKSCGDCIEFSDAEYCKLYHSFVARFFSFIFRSNRKAGIDYIKEYGYTAFAEMMAEHKLKSLKR